MRCLARHDFGKICRLFVDERQLQNEMDPFLGVRSSVTDVADLPTLTATTSFKIHSFNLSQHTSTPALSIFRRETPLTYFPLLRIQTAYERERQPQGAGL